MVEFPLLVRRQGFALRLVNLSQIPRSADINFVSSNRDLALADMWETITFAASFHARLNVAAVDVSRRRIGSDRLTEVGRRPLQFVRNCAKPRPASGLAPARCRRAPARR